jgi:hypothetical protein
LDSDGYIVSADVGLNKEFRTDNAVRNRGITLIDEVFFIDLG